MTQDKLFQGVIATVLGLCLAWVATTLNSNQIELAKLQVQIGQLSKDISYAVDERRSTAAMLRDHDLRLTKLEAR